MKRVHKKELAMRELSVLVLVVAIYAIVCLIQPRFFSGRSIINICLYVPFLLIVALGEMIEIISRNVDLSLGAILAVAAYVVCLIFMKNPDFPIVAAFFVAMAVGAGLGLVNGIFTVGFKIPSVIVTLGTMNIYRGMIFVLGGKQVDNSVIPQKLIQMSQPAASVVGIPYTVIIAVLITVLVALFMKKSRIGRDIYAAGNNPKAAVLKGISLKKVGMVVFCLAGALSGFAGLIFVSRIGYLDPGQAGRGLEFTAIAAVVIGGTSMNGGIGTTIGTFLGCMLLGVVNNAISITGISGYWQEAIYGIIIVAAVIMDKVIKDMMDRRKGGKA